MKFILYPRTCTIMSFSLRFKDKVHVKKTFLLKNNGGVAFLMQSPILKNNNVHEMLPYLFSLKWCISKNMICPVKNTRPVALKINSHGWWTKEEKIKKISWSLKPNNGSVLKEVTGALISKTETVLCLVHGLQEWGTTPIYWKCVDVQDR